MRSFPRIGLSAALVVFAGMLGACSSSSNNVAPTSVRLVNATTAGATSPVLDLSLSGAPAVTAVAVGSASGYVSQNPSTYAESVTDETGTLSSGTPLTVNLGTGESYTIVAYTLGTTVAMGYLTDNLGIPSSGQSTVAFANFSTDAGPLDVYVLPQNTASVPAGAQPVYGSVTGQSLPVTEAAGNYTIIATKPNTPGDIRFINQSVNLTGGQAEVMAFTPTSGGGLVNGMLIVQGGNPTTMAMAYARVRIAAELPSGTSLVTASVVSGATTTPVASVNAPFVGTYTLVPAGSVTWSNVTSAAGTVVTTGLPSSLTAGGDYSLVVYGTTPTAELLADDNQYPGNGSGSLRLVNVSGTSVSMLVDYAPFPSAASPTTTSSYYGVTPSSNAPTITLNGGAISLLDPPNSLVAGSVYTVFVYASSGTGAFLSKDR